MAPRLALLLEPAPAAELIDPAPKWRRVRGRHWLEIADQAGGAVVIRFSSSAAARRFRRAMRGEHG